jgi:hypothetical protein
MSTYDDTILFDFGTTNSDWEFYADEAAFGCNCDIIEGSVCDLPDDRYGQHYGDSECHIPNSATVPPSSTGEPGAGTIYQITYTYAWRVAAFWLPCPMPCRKRLHL